MDDLISKVRNLVSGSHIANEAPIPYMSRRMGFDSSDDTMAVAERAYGAYGSVGTLFAIVNQLANAFAMVEWHLYRRTSVRDKSRRQEVLNHAFMTLWDRPNPFYTGRLFRETVQTHIDLVGEGVIVLYRVGNVITEMWPVRPDRIEPIKHPTKFLTGYVYRNGNEEVPLELNQVIHIRTANPSDVYRGMGPVQSLLNDIDAARYAAEWNRNFFINGAQPGGVIKVGYRMGEREFEEFLSRWRNQHQGVANAHRVAVLENADWVDTKFSMEDMQFVELRNLPRELIREAFAFPKPMLGTVEDVNRANAQAGKVMLAENHTLPRLERWKDVVNAFLLPQFANGSNLVLDHDDPVPPNYEDEDRARTSKATAAATLVSAGYNRTQVLAAVGLPDMEWSEPGSTNALPIEQGNAQPSLGWNKRQRPVIDVDCWYVDDMSITDGKEEV